MLAITWFGFLPRSDSYNVFENPDAPFDIHSRLFRRDVGGVMCNSAFSDVSFDDLYMVRRSMAGSSGILTWVARCETVQSETHSRDGSYRGVGIWLHNQTVRGPTLIQALTALRDAIGHYVPNVLPGRFDLAKAAEQYQRNEGDSLSKEVRRLLSIGTSPCDPSGGLTSNLSKTGTCVIDLSDVDPSAYGKVLQECLDRIQQHSAYQHFSEAYLSANPMVIAAAHRIFNVRIVRPGWEVSEDSTVNKNLPTQAPKKMEKIPPQLPVNIQNESDENDRIKEIERWIRKKMPDEVRDIISSELIFHENKKKYNNQNLDDNKVNTRIKTYSTYAALAAPILLVVQILFFSMNDWGGKAPASSQTTTTPHVPTVQSDTDSKQSKEARDALAVIEEAAQKLEDLKVEGRLASRVQGMSMELKAMHAKFCADALNGAECALGK